MAAGGEVRSIEGFGPVRPERVSAKARGLFSMGALALILSGCSSEQLPALGFPRGVTDINDRSHFLWQWAWIAAFVVGAFTAVLILWAAFRYRAKRRVTTGGPEQLPEQVSYHMPLEIMYTVIPFIIVAVLFYSPLEINLPLRRFHLLELQSMKSMSTLFNGRGSSPILKRRKRRLRVRRRSCPLFIFLLVSAFASTSLPLMLCTACGFQRL